MRRINWIGNNSAVYALYYPDMCLKISLLYFKNSCFSNFITCKKGFLMAIICSIKSSTIIIFWMFIQVNDKLYIEWGMILHSYPHLILAKSLFGRAPSDSDSIREVILWPKVILQHKLLKSGWRITSRIKRNYSFREYVQASRGYIVER